jgi:hypothetical protein
MCPTKERTKYLRAERTRPTDTETERIVSGDSVPKPLGFIAVDANPSWCFFKILVLGSSLL